MHDANKHFEITCTAAWNECSQCSYPRWLADLITTEINKHRSTYKHTTAKILVLVLPDGLCGVKRARINWEWNRQILTEKKQFEIKFPVKTMLYTSRSAINYYYLHLKLIHSGLKEKKNSMHNVNLSVPRTKY